MLQDSHYKQLRPVASYLIDVIYSILRGKFDIDYPQVVFCDLFAGTGRLPLLIQRRHGLKFIYFVEKDRQPVVKLRKHLVHKQIFNTKVIQASVFDLHLKNTKCDIVFMDPPYRFKYSNKLLKMLLDSNYVTNETLIILKADITDTIHEDIMSKYTLLHEYKYKFHQVLFLRISV